MIGKVHLRELPERDVRWPPNAVMPFENPGPLGRLDVLRLPLVGGLRARAIAMPAQPEMVMPVVIAFRRRRTDDGIRRAIGQLRVTAAAFEDAHQWVCSVRSSRLCQRSMSFSTSSRAMRMARIPGG